MVTAVNLTNGVAVGEEMDASETAPPEVRLVSVNTAARLLDIGRTTTFCLGPPLHLARPRVRDGREKVMVSRPRSTSFHRRATSVPAWPPRWRPIE